MTEELRHYELSLTLWEELIQLQAFPLLDPFIIRQDDKIGWGQSKQYDSMLRQTFRLWSSCEEHWSSSADLIRDALSSGL